MKSLSRPISSECFKANSVEAADIGQRLFV